MGGDFFCVRDWDNKKIIFTIICILIITFTRVLDKINLYKYLKIWKTEINICEMKFSANEYEIDKDYEKKLINKIECFRKKNSSKKSSAPYHANNLWHKTKRPFRQGAE